ncbi:MAG: phage holin family protein [Bradyrhizobium sp.]|uniref:phage holin family protein n=1 Tax=Bradyrhizobium sp. TaxID=376 RepID=UPI001C2A1EF3|nr:phage holin family protein [Bradyrhizobium sp.]MBU6463583.1 phage holin family protein [Pseudomonadota bacterium]MDE2067031.1 phage holin family protein [Bradyrhizobium sp.]MDE2241239.1 phage holin family protein [Bradyrhizobium sp.]MDE2470764.1 phage holin family protein [Bradyrhizobium sp.]
MSINNDVQSSKNDLRIISTLLGDALSQFTKLFQNEVDLAKAELGEKVQKISSSLGLITGGAVLIIPGLVMALFALSAALMSAGWSQPISYLLSAILALVIAGILLAIGFSRLNARNLAPRETMKQLRRDKNAVKGIVR